MNVTVLELGVVLNAVPLMVTVVPTGPLVGLKLIRLRVEEV